MGYEYAGIAYERQGEMLAARRRHYVELVLAGMGYAEAARAVGVSKRTGKAWRNGRTRSTGRNEAPCAEWTEAAMPQPKPTGPRYLSMDERIFIADGPVCGLSMSAIASRLGRSRSTVCREVARNRDRGTGRYTPYRAGEAYQAYAKPADVGPSEMALHGKISVALDMDVYFCDPHSPWQRGANENTNGLMRRYFPKGTDLSIFPEECLDAVAEELNGRPRKTLGRRKPSEVFLELASDSLTA